jgi:hypothetical protein
MFERRRMPKLMLKILQKNFEEFMEVNHENVTS